MNLKMSDDVQPRLRALRVDMERSQSAIRTRLEEQIRIVSAGAAAQKQAEYDIEFYLRGDPNHVTIHDLRVEFDGRVAQIDHVIINRALTISLCESKSFSGGVAVNDHGEWSRHYNGEWRGISSPIEQNKRHVSVLEDVIKSGAVLLPKRLGFDLKPRLRGLVLLSATADFKRPEGAAASGVEGLDSVVKADQLVSKIDREVEQWSPLTLMTNVLRVVGSRTVEGVGRQLVALHKPRTSNSTELCAACGSSISAKVANYCCDHAAMFGGAVYCMACQDVVAHGEVRSRTAN